MGLEQIGLEAILKDENFQAGLKRYQDGIGNMSQSTDQGANIITRLGSVMQGALVAGVGAAVVAFGALTAASKVGLDSAMAWGEQLDKLGDQFGLTGEQASTWTVAMNHVGLSVDEGAAGLNFLTKQLDDFGKTNAKGVATVTPFSTALGKLGINAKDSSGKVKSFDAIMPEIMDKFSKLPAGVNASALAMDLFGGKGGKFMDFLRQGSSGLADAKKMAEDFGLTMGTDGVNSLEEYGNAMNDLNLGFTGIKNQIGMAVLPFAKQLMEWAKGMIPSIVQLAKAFGDGLGGALTNVMGAAEKFGWLIDAIKEAGIVSGETQEVLGSIFGDEVASALMDIATVMQRMAVAIMPTFQKVAARIWTELQKVAKDVIPLVVKQVQKFSAWFKENEPLITKTLKVIAEKFGDLAVGVIGAWRVIGPAIDGIITLVLDLVKIVMQAINGDWSGAWDTAKKIVSDTWNAIKNVSIAFGNWIASWMGTTLSGIAEQWRANWDMFVVILNAALANLSNLIQSGFNSIKAAIQAAWDSIRNAAIAAWQTITQAINSAILAIPQAIAGAIASLIQIGIDIVNSIGQGISDTWEALTSLLSDFLMGLASSVINSDIVQALLGIGTTIVNAIKLGISTLWGAAEGVVGKLRELLAGLVDGLSDAYGSVMNAGGRIVDAIRQGIINNWNGFVDWLKGIIGGIFGGGSGYGVNGLGQGSVVTGSFGQQAMATQYSSSVMNTQNFYLTVNSMSPVSTVVQDFHTMQSLAAV